MTIDITPHIEERAAKNAPAVVVYGKPACNQCDMTRRLMQREGIEYGYVDITEDASAFKFITETLGYSQAPVVYVDHGGDMGVSTWSGFLPANIKAITERAA